MMVYSKVVGGNSRPFDPQLDELRAPPPTPAIPTHALATRPVGLRKNGHIGTWDQHGREFK